MDFNGQSQNNKLTKQPASSAGLKSSSAEIKASSPVYNAFTLNRQRPMGTEHNEPQNLPISTPQTTLKESANIGQKRIAECNKTSVEKRPKIATRGGYPSSTKQLTITPAQTPNSLCSLRVTKPIGNVQGQSFMKEYDSALLLAPTSHMPDHQRGTQSQGSTATTIGQVTPQSMSFISRASLDLSGSEVSRSNDFNHLTKEIFIDKFSGPADTPYSQETGLKDAPEHETAIASTTIMGFPDQRGFCNNGDVSCEIAGAIQNTAINDLWSESSDAYPLDDDIADDDIIQLLANSSGPVEENHIPPSSIQGWDHESRSATEYDPSLKYSPPDLTETGINVAQLGRAHSNCQPELSEDLLNEDVDWDAVLVNLDTIQRDSSIDSHPNLERTERGNVVMYTKKPGDSGSHLNEVKPLTTFVRPPFPDKIRDRPSVPGMSSNTLLRTCFRIGMMIKQTIYCANHKQDVVFELYARVTYSSRETLVRKQHFQFVDLYKDQEPYPAATLSNWRMGSRLDKDSSAFLDTSSGPRLCWCMCKPMKDSKAAIGWTYKVLNIREIDHEELHWAKRIICADSEQPSSETVAAKL